MEATMKSFKEYLTESKKVYEFKVKIAGDIPKDFANNLKIALAQFNVESIKNATVSYTHLTLPTKRIV